MHAHQSDQTESEWIKKGKGRYLSLLLISQFKPKHYNNHEHTFTESINPNKINIKYQFPATTDYKDNNLEILKLKFCYARTDWDCPILGLSYKTSNP